MALPLLLGAIALSALGRLFRRSRQGKASNQNPGQSPQQAQMQGSTQSAGNTIRATPPVSSPTSQQNPTTTPNPGGEGRSIEPFQQRERGSLQVAGLKPRPTPGPGGDPDAGRRAGLESTARETSINKATNERLRKKAGDSPGSLSKASLLGVPNAAQR